MGKLEKVFIKGYVKEIEAKCPKCGVKTKGFVLNSISIKNVYCEKCVEGAEKKEVEETRDTEVSMLLNKSRIPKRFVGELHGKRKLKLTQQQVPLKKTLEKAILNKSGVGMPYFFGTNGTGKTYLSYYIAIKKAEEELKDIYFLNVPEWAVDTRERVSRDSLRAISSCGVLILDDIGSHSLYPNIIEALYYITDKRLSFSSHTIVTSVHTPFELPSVLEGDNNSVPSSLCEAIADRLFSLCKVTKVAGESLRINGAKEFYK